MSGREIIYTGYIRTCCWSKIESIFKNVDIVKLSMNRSSNDRRNYETSPFIKKWVYATGHYNLDWEFWKHNVPYEKAINEFIEGQFEYRFRDFLVKRIEVGIKDSELVDMINKKIGTSIPSDSSIYVTYVDPKRKDGLSSLDVEPVKKINAIAIKNLHFKTLSILDLGEVHTYNNFDDVMYKALEHKDIIKKIIKCVDTERWFKLPEVKQLDEKYYPGSVRTYEKRKSDNWVLVSDNEVR